MALLEGFRHSVRPADAALGEALQVHSALARARGDLVEARMVDKSSEARRMCLTCEVCDRVTPPGLLFNATHYICGKRKKRERK